MIVTLDEMKKYLRVDYDDDDEFIENAITSSENLCADIARVDGVDLLDTDIAKMAVLYAVAYLYEHREEADHNSLTLSLRALLFGERKECF